MVPCGTLNRNVELPRKLHREAWMRQTSHDAVQLPGQFRTKRLFATASCACRVDTTLGRRPRRWAPGPNGSNVAGFFACHAAMARRFGRPGPDIGAFLNLQERMGYSLERAQSFRPTWIQELVGHLQTALGRERFDSLVRRGRQTPPEVLAVPSRLTEDTKAEISGF